MRAPLLVIRAAFAPPHICVSPPEYLAETQFAQKSPLSIGMGTRELSDACTAGSARAAVCTAPSCSPPPTTTTGVLPPFFRKSHEAPSWVLGQRGGAPALLRPSCMHVFFLPRVQNPGSVMVHQKPCIVSRGLHRRPRVPLLSSRALLHVKTPYDPIYLADK